MSEYETVAVPFVAFGNRRGLTEKQLFESQWLKEFFDMFRDSFEYDELKRVYLFIEQDRPHHSA